MDLFKHAVVTYKWIWVEEVNAEFVLHFLTRILVLMCNYAFDEIELCE